MKGPVGYLNVVVHDDSDADTGQDNHRDPTDRVGKGNIPPEAVDPAVKSGPFAKLVDQHAISLFLFHLLLGLFFSTVV